MYVTLSWIGAAINGKTFLSRSSIISSNTRRLLVLSIWLEPMVKCFMKTCGWIFLSSFLEKWPKINSFHEKTKLKDGKKQIPQDCCSFFEHLDPAVPEFYLLVYCFILWTNIFPLLLKSICYWFLSLVLESDLFTIMMTHLGLYFNLFICTSVDCIFLPLCGTHIQISHELWSDGISDSPSRTVLLGRVLLQGP